MYAIALTVALLVGALLVTSAPPAPNVTPQATLAPAATCTNPLLCDNGGGPGGR